MKNGASSDNTPDPSNEPVPVDAKEIEPLTTSFRKVFGGLFAVAVGGGLLIPAMAPTRCMGSTRSTRLIWEERETEIERAIRGAEADATEDGDGAEKGVLGDGRTISGEKS